MTTIPFLHDVPNYFGDTAFIYPTGANMQVFLEPRTLYDTAIISTDNQITKYSISKILIILEADMSTEEAIDFFY